MFDIWLKGMIVFLKSNSAGKPADNDSHILIPMLNLH